MGDLNSVRVAEERFFLVSPHQRELDRDALRDIHSEEEHWERQGSLVQIPSKEQAHSFNHRSGGWSARLTRAYADFGFTEMGRQRWLVDVDQDMPTVHATDHRLVGLKVVTERVRREPNGLAPVPLWMLHTERFESYF